MSISNWRQSPPVKRSSRTSPNPPGYPLLTGYTTEQAEKLQMDTDGLQDVVRTTKHSFWGFVRSVARKAEELREASGSSARHPKK